MFILKNSEQQVPEISLQRANLIILFQAKSFCRIKWRAKSFRAVGCWRADAGCGWPCAACAALLSSFLFILTGSTSDKSEISRICPEIMSATPAMRRVAGLWLSRSMARHAPMAASNAHLCGTEANILNFTPKAKHFSADVLVGDFLG